MISLFINTSRHSSIQFPFIEKGVRRQKAYVLMNDDLGNLYDTNCSYTTKVTESEFSGKSRAEFIKATKKFDKKVRKIVKMLEELRSEPNELMKQHIDLALEDNQEEAYEELKFGDVLK